MNIIYINGYKGEKSSKAKKLSKLLHLDIEHVVYNFDKNNIDEITEKSKKADIIIGSSTGAFIGRIIAEKYDIPLISLNPVVDLEKTFRKIGVPVPDIPSPIYARIGQLNLVNKDDDLIDYTETVSTFPNCKIYEKGGHRFSNLEETKEDILNFIKTLKKDRTPETIKYLLQRIKEAPQYLLHYEELSSLYLSKDRKEEAIQILKKANKIDSTDKKALLGLASLEHHMIENYQEALVYYTKLIKILSLNNDSTQLSEVFRSRGMVYSSLKEHSKSINDFTKAIKLSSDCNAYDHRGYEYIRLEKYDEALADFKKLVRNKFDPHFDPHLEGIIELLKETKELYVGLSKIDNSTNEFLEKEIKYLENRFYLINDEIYFKNTLKKYSALMKIDPNNEEIYSDRANFYFWGAINLMDDSYYEKALEDYDYLIILNPKNASYYYLKSEIYSLFPQSEKQIECLEKAIAINPKKEYVKQLDFLKNKDSRIADFIQRIKRLKAEKENIEDDIKKIYAEATKVGIALGEIK